MTYPTNSVKQDPESGMIAQRTNNDGDRAWIVFRMAGNAGTSHFVPEDAVAGWSDLAPVVP